MSSEEKKVALLKLENFSVAQLPELQGKKEEINAIIEANPIVEIIDNATYELAKKSRTAVKTLRTGLEKEQKDVKRKIKEHILDVVDTEYNTLVSDVKQEETNRQDPITAYETKKEEERLKKELLEKQRIDTIKNTIDNYVSEWKTAFNIMCFETIEKVSAEFYESYINYDLTILEEFEALFPAKIEELTQYLSEKTTALTTAENARLEKEKLEAEAQKLAEEKAAFEAQQKAAADAEEKAKAEREAFEKEKRDFEQKQAIAAKKETFEKRKQILLDLGFTYDLNREYNFSLKDVWSCFHEQIDDCTDEWFAEYLLDIKEAIKQKQAEPLVAEIQTPTTTEEPVIAAPVKPTVNVCTSLEHVPETPQIITWDTIIEDFKTSGEKSYSAWLKNNYNVPTKINKENK